MSPLEAWPPAHEGTGQLPADWQERVDAVVGRHEAADRGAYAEHARILAALDELVCNAPTRSGLPCQAWPGLDGSGRCWRHRTPITENTDERNER